MVPLCEYELDLDEKGVPYGHPDTNGKGHKKTWSENEWWVMVPPKSRRKLVGREHLIDHSIIKDISDNQLALSADELVVQQSQHHAMHDLPRATGEKGYAPLMAAPIAAAPPPAAAAAAPPTSTPIMNDPAMPSGIAVGFGIVLADAPTPKAATGTAEASDKEVEGSTPATKGKGGKKNTSTAPATTARKNKRGVPAPAGASTEKDAAPGESASSNSSKKQKKG